MSRTKAIVVTKPRGRPRLVREVEAVVDEQPAFVPESPSDDLATYLSIVRHLDMPFALGAAAVMIAEANRGRRRARR